MPRDTRGTPGALETLRALLDEETRRSEIERIEHEGIVALQKLGRVHHMTVAQALDAWMELFDLLEEWAALRGEMVTLDAGALGTLEGYYARKLQGAGAAAFTGGQPRFYRFVRGFAGRMREQAALLGGARPVAQFPLATLLGLGPFVRVNPGASPGSASAVREELAALAASSR